MSIPLVSVIIPNYNHAAYLHKRVQSVLDQSFRNFEILLLDDFSQDNSQQIIDEFTKQDARISVVANTANSGSVFRQWQKGLALAKGKYVWIAESDDFAAPHFLSTLLPLLEEDELCVFAYSNSLIVDENDQAIEPISELKKRVFNGCNHWDTDYIADGRQELNQYLAFQCTVNNASAVLFRRTSILAAGGVDVNFRYAGDWLMYIKLSLLGHIAYKTECLNYYREHSANASKHSFTNGEQNFERQKCFAFIYSKNALSTINRKLMLQHAGKEFFRLAYMLMRELKQPKRLLSMLAALSRISPSYYLQMQYRALKMTRAGEKWLA